MEEKGSQEEKCVTLRGGDRRGEEERKGTCYRERGMEEEEEEKSSVCLELENNKRRSGHV